MGRSTLFAMMGIGLVIVVIGAILFPFVYQTALLVIPTLIGTVLGVALLFGGAAGVVTGDDPGHKPPTGTHHP
jgi:hypothetical protein